MNLCGLFVNVDDQDVGLRGRRLNARRRMKCFQFIESEIIMLNKAISMIEVSGTPSLEQLKREGEIILGRQTNNAHIYSNWKMFSRNVNDWMLEHYQDKYSEFDDALKIYSEPVNELS